MARAADKLARMLFRADQPSWLETARQCETSDDAFLLAKSIVTEVWHSSTESNDSPFRDIYARLDAAHTVSSMQAEISALQSLAEPESDDSGDAAEAQEEVSEEENEEDS